MMGEQSVNFAWPLRRKLLRHQPRYHSSYYGAFVSDMESNVIEAVFHERSTGGAATTCGEGVERLFRRLARLRPLPLQTGCCRSRTSVERLQGPKAVLRAIVRPMTAAP